jgi:hypothetical protein
MIMWNHNITNGVNNMNNVNKTWTTEIVDRIKEEALNLEDMYTSHDDYIAAMDDLIAHFTQSKQTALENNE